MGKFIAAGLVVALVASFFGAVHGLGDSLAVFRVAWAGLLLIVAGRMAGPVCLRAPLVMLAVAGLGSVAWHKIPQDSAGPVVLYQKNMKFTNTDIAGLAADIAASGADIVTLEEVSAPNEALLAQLKDTYPHQHLCRKRSSGTAVLSRHPMVGEPVCGKGMGFAATQVQIKGQQIWAVAIHLSWPYPKAQYWQVGQLDRLFSQMEGPSVVAGDFNAVPWSYTLDRVAELTGTRWAGPSSPTFFLGSIPLTIDHVLAPGGGRVETRPILGGDHQGLLAHVHLVDAGQAE